MQSRLLYTLLLSVLPLHSLGATLLTPEDTAAKLLVSIVQDSHVLGAQSQISLVDSTNIGFKTGMAANLAASTAGIYSFNAVGKDSGSHLVSIGALVGLTVGVTVNAYSKFLEGGDALGKVWVRPEHATTASFAEEWVFNDTYERFKVASEKLGLKMECENDCKPEYSRFSQQKGKRYLKFTTDKDTWWMTWTSGNFIESFPDAERQEALGFKSGYESQGLSSWRIRLEGRALGIAPYPMKGAWNTSPWKEFLEYVTDNSTQHLYITPEANAIFYQGKRIASDEIAPKSN